MTWACLTFVSQREASRKDRRGGDPEIRCTTLPMGNLRTVMSAALLSFAACSGDGAAKPDAPLIHLDAAIDAVPDAPPPIDAPSYDFTCLNNTAPTTASATISVSGTTQVLNGMTPTPAGMVSLEARKVSDDSLLDIDGPTAAQGAYTLGPITTTGVPVDAYIKATRAGTAMERTTLVFTPQPLVASQMNVPVLMVSDAQINAIGQGVFTQDPAKGFFGVFVVDCAGTPVADASLFVKKNGTSTGTAVDLGTFFPQAAGTWFVFNVDPGDIVVNAMLGANTFRAHTVKSAAATTTTTVVRPGF